MAKLFSTFKKAQGALGGGIMVICSFVLMWAGISSGIATDDKLQGLVSEAKEIDTSAPDPSDNGKLVVAAGNLRSSDAYEDEFLKPNPALIVQRRVEMLQWVESFDKEGDDPAYSLRWTEAQVDFFKFKVPQGHENPLFQVSPIRYQAERSRFGGFDGGRLLPLIKILDPLELKPELLKNPNSEISDNKIVVRRNGGSDLPNLGDMRVWYEALPQGDYTVLTVQQDERNLVGASPSATLFIRPGLLSPSDFLEKMEGDVSDNFRGTFYLGGLLMFAGCLSLMMPHSRRFDLRPHLNAQGSLAVVVVSALISFVAMAIFFLLSLSQ